MGLIHAEIEIINGDDLVLARKSLIGEEEVKRMNVQMLVDTGAINLCINENVQEYMQFPVSEYRTFVVATGESKELLVVENVKIKFKNRITACRAIVLPGDSEMLLGAIPMEDLDVVINTRRQELDVNPESPDMAMSLLPYLRSINRPITTGIIK
ncbi:MAG: aspartyl protease family protein [Chitinophagaceae bacterium]|nr:aspartyl protease family protein [Chitinophagaceae bacterium]